jgi:ankyrin repeat protein
MVAAENGNASLARLLLEKGADVKHTDDDGEHALIEAAIEGHTEVASLLLQHGAQIDLQDHARWTALMQASASGFPEVVKVFCGAGADPTKTNKFGRTAIEYATGIEGTSSLSTVAELTSAAERGVLDHDEMYYVLKRKGSGRDYDGVVRILETYEKEFHTRRCRQQPPRRSVA